VQMAENNTKNGNQIEDNSIEISILRKGWTNLYWKEKVLNHDIELLKRLEYKIEDFNCTQIADEDELHTELQKKLNFPDYYGRNFNALNDCLSSDIDITEKGLVIVFRHLDKFNLKTIHTLLDVFVTNARQHFIFGKKLLILVQVDNPDFIIEPVGAIGLYWNDKEWLNKNRR
jgi:RNAse (barnase) inhibitor barstar